MLGEWLLGVDLHDTQGAALEVALHAGTLLAVLMFVWPDLVALLRAVTAREPDGPARQDARRLLRAVVLASIPAGIVGVAFGPALERLFASPVVAGVGFLVTAAVLIASARLSHRQARTAPSLRPAEALLIGVAQLIAITPGISRSGSTIVSGMALGLTPAEAGRFSFLMAIPVTGGAALLKARAILATPVDQRGALLLGVVVAFVSGFFALRFLVMLLRRGRLSAFAWYVLPLGVLTLWLACRGA